MRAELIRSVVEWPLARVMAWLDGVSIGEPVGGEDFNWELFASVTASRARKERDVSWAHLALQIYGVLAAHSPAGYAYSFMYSAMNLRSWMIEKIGARDGDPVLDPEILFAWFQSLAFISSEEAARMVSSDMGSLPVETLLKLRYIKTALNLLSRISEIVRRHPELNDWLQLKNSLP